MNVHQPVPHLITRFPSYSILFSGTVAGLVFAAGWPGWLLSIALLPWFYYASQPKTNWYQGLWLAVWFFLPFHAVVLSWFLDTNVSSLIGAGPGMALFAQIFSWLLMTVILTLCTLPLGYVVYRLRPLAARPVPFTWLLLPAAWVLCEWLRSIGFSLFLYGRGATIGDYWNFGSFGLGLMNTPLAYLSRLIGMYGLSFLTVLLTLALGRALFRRKYNPFAFVLASTLVLSLLVVLVTNRQNRTDSKAPPHPASVLQRSIDLASDYRADTPIRNRSADKKDLIVLPEYSEAFDPGATVFSDTFVTQRLAIGGISVDVDRGRTQKWYGTLEFRDYRGQVVHHNTKQLLIPTGEYLPYIFTSFYQLTGQQHIVDRFEEYRRVYKGDPPAIYRTPQFIVGPVACSGILGRPIYQKLTRDGATVLTNSASLVDFNGSKSYFRQSILMARFHAIANNRLFIQSTRGAPAFVLDNDGRYIVRPAGSDTRFIDFSFHSLSAKTIYTRVGEWPLLGSFGIVGVVVLEVIRKHRS